MDRKPIGNTVMLKERPIQGQEVEGGIIIPDAFINEKEFYVVVKLGTGQLDKNGVMIPFQVDIDDVVIISKENPATTVNWEGVKVLIINQFEIIAKVNI